MERAVRFECVWMKAARRADFTFGVAARLRAPPALNAAGTATDATKATTAIRLGAFTSSHSRVPVSQGKSSMSRRYGSADQVAVDRCRHACRLGGPNQVLAGLRQLLP